MHKEKKTTADASDEGAATVRLNKYIADCGVCSRREADELIRQGEITVNEQLVTQLGIRVGPEDEVKYQNKVISPQRFVYVLLNKPKDFITTTDDPQNRKTVMQLVKNACRERIYPVGRLDRNTTGLLLFTNDGLLAKKLSHPSHKVKKVYQVELDKPFDEKDLEKLTEGIALEDGRAWADEVAILDARRKTLGLELHVGKNRIVRRMFEALGYAVAKLDRTIYAGLDKKNLPRGKWRFLHPKEVRRLKHFLEV